MLLSWCLPHPMRGKHPACPVSLGSCLPCRLPSAASPCREEAAERARAIEAELAVGGLDDVQREVLASDLQRLQQRLGL